MDSGLTYAHYGVDPATGMKVVPVEIYRRWDDVLVLNMPSLFYIDYDMPSDRHAFEESVVGESLEHLRRGLANINWAACGLPGGDPVWRIHRTAGGLHAFRMDTEILPDRRAYEALLAAPCDPRFAKLVRNTRYWPIRFTRKRPDEGAVYEVVDTGDESRYAPGCRIQIKTFMALVAREA